MDVETDHRETALEYYPLDDDSIRNAAEQKVEPTPQGAKLVTERAETSDTLPKQIKGVLKLSGARSYTFDIPVGALVTQTASSGEPGLFFAIVLAFAGGIILNLMPCVFPGTILKGSLAGQQRKRKHARGSGVMESPIQPGYFSPSGSSSPSC